MCADVERFGPLDLFSAFCFESYLGQLKKLIKSPNKPLQQVFRRLHEIRQSSNDSDISFNHKIEYFMPHNNGPYNFRYKQLKKIALGDCTFCIYTYNIADSYCKLVDGVVQIDNIMVNSENGDTVLIGKRFKRYKSFYSYPVESTLFDISIVDYLSDDLRTWNLKDVLCFFLCQKIVLLLFP